MGNMGQCGSQEAAMYEYSRDVYYYETDRMDVVHHSNYLRWMEEARTKLFADLGLPYDVTESLGVLCPVVSVDLRFKMFARFGDRFTVRLRMPRYTGVRFAFAYSVTNQRGEVLAEGESSHAFIAAGTYRPVSLAKVQPRLHEGMLRAVEPDED
jgi:acyl-CoA thioester hydrolase